MGYRQRKHDDPKYLPVVHAPESEGPVPEQRRYKLMAEYSAFPIWDISGDGPYGWQYMVDPETLPISDRLRTDLEAWAAFYECPSGSRRGRKGWYAQGRRLARDLQAELGPDCEVVFFNEKGNEEPVPPSN